MLREDDPGDDIRERDIGSHRNGPSALEHRLVDGSHERDVEQRSRDRSACGGDHRQGRPAPRVQHATGGRGLDDFLANQCEEQHHPNVVHGEGDGVRQSVIAFGVQVDPHQSNGGPEWQQKQVLADDLREPRQRRAPRLRASRCAASRSDLGRVDVPSPPTMHPVRDGGSPWKHPACHKTPRLLPVVAIASRAAPSRWTPAIVGLCFIDSAMTPESTVVPVREIVRKCSSAPTTSTSMKL
jgi:hypothetical protein